LRRRALLRLHYLRQLSRGLDARRLADGGKHLAKLRGLVNGGVHAAIPAVLHDEGDFMDGEEARVGLRAALVLRAQAEFLRVAILGQLLELEFAADEHIVAAA